MLHGVPPSPATLCFFECFGLTPPQLACNFCVPGTTRWLSGVEKQNLARCYPRVFHVSKTVDHGMKLHGKANEMRKHPDQRGNRPALLADHERLHSTLGCIRGREVRRHYLYVQLVRTVSYKRYIHFTVQFTDWSSVTGIWDFTSPQP